MPAVSVEELLLLRLLLGEPRLLLDPALGLLQLLQLLLADVCLRARRHVMLVSGFKSQCMVGWTILTRRPTSSPVIET